MGELKREGEWGQGEETEIKEKSPSPQREAVWKEKEE